MKTENKWKRIETNTCVRCWLDKKIVREEWSRWCYHYGEKVANRHMRTYNEVETDEIYLWYIKD